MCVREREKQRQRDSETERERDRTLRETKQDSTFLSLCESLKHFTQFV